MPPVKESNASSSEGLQDVDNARSEVDLEEIKADLERQQIISNSVPEGSQTRRRHPAPIYVPQQETRAQSRRRLQEHRISLGRPLLQEEQKIAPLDEPEAIMIDTV